MGFKKGWTRIGFVFANNTGIDQMGTNYIHKLFEMARARCNVQQILNVVLQYCAQKAASRAKSLARCFGLRFNDIQPAKTNFMSLMRDNPNHDKICKRLRESKLLDKNTDFITASDSWLRWAARPKDQPIEHLKSGVQWAYEVTAAIKEFKEDVFTEEQEKYMKKLGDYVKASIMINELHDKLHAQNVGDYTWGTVGSFSPDFMNLI